MNFAPIIPQRRSEPLTDPAWACELKLDGFRGLADTLVFVGNPFMKFRTLRNEVSARLTEYDNVMAQYKQLKDDNYQLVRLDLSEAEQKRLAEAELTFRKLGSELKALTENEGWLNWILELCGYHPANAGSGLIGLSNSIATYGMNRHHFKKLIRSGLKLPEN